MSRHTSLSVTTDRVQISGPAKGGDPTDRRRILAGEGACADWRTVLLTATAPIEVFLEWTVGRTYTKAQLVTAAGTAVSLFARDLKVSVAARKGGTTEVQALVYDGRTDTRNSWVEWVTGPESGSRLQYTVPPYAQSVRLEPGDAAASAELTLVDAYNKARIQRAGGPGEAVEAVLGASPHVFVHLPANVTGRLIYPLPF